MIRSHRVNSRALSVFAVSLLLASCASAPPPPPPPALTEIPRGVLDAFCARLHDEGVSAETTVGDVVLGTTGRRPEPLGGRKTDAAGHEVNMRPVIVRSSGTLRNDIEAGPYTLIADEPVDSGGTAAGPTPYDFLNAALGACTSMTIHVVAKREKIPVESVEVTVTNDRMYAKDCAD